MSKSVANVVIATDTFVGWIGKTNTLLDLMTNQTLTTEYNAYGGNTSGNASVLGILSSNVIATPVVRGGSAGNTATISAITVGHANSTTSSNVTVAGYLANVAANTLSISSNTTLTATSLTAAVTTANLVGNVVFGSNSSHNLTVHGNNLTVNTSKLGVSANITFEGNTVVIESDIAANGTLYSITSDTVSMTGANVYLAPDMLNIFANVNATYAFSVANTLTVTDTMFVDTDVVFTGNSSAITQSTASYNFANTTETTVIDSFPIATYKTAKYTLSAKNTANSNVMQISELNLVHGNAGSNSVHSTEFGIIYSATKFATYTPGANATHVYITANSSVSNVAFTLLRTSFK